MLPFTADDIQNWIGASTHFPKKNDALSLVATDSREVVPQALFVALPGVKTDGHHFLEEVSKKGASHAIVNQQYSGPDFGMTLFRVDNTLLALQKAAEGWLQRSIATRIAITGSVGKTTTKGFLCQILQSKYRAATSSGNKNSQSGMSIAILNETKGNEQFLVFEMGMTEPLQIKRLTEIAPPDIALITEIALAHAGGFASIEAIAEAKAEIFSHSKTALGIYSKDAVAQSVFESAQLPKKSYSMKHCEADFRLQVEGESIVLHEAGASVQLPFRDFPADHVYSNLLAAISVARTVGMTGEEIGATLHTLTLPERRLQEISKNGVSFINDCYNASITSMKGALNAVQKRKVAGRKIGVFGAIRELGKFSEMCHRELGEAALDVLDEIICIGAECQPLVDVWQKAGKKISWHLTFDELMKKVQERVCTGDLVLVKGARFFQLERVLENFAP